MGTLLKLSLRDKTTESIIRVNNELTTIYLAKFNLLSNTEKNEVVEEYFKTSPSSLITETQYAGFNNERKVHEHIKMKFLFYSKENILTDYMFWSLLEPTQRKEYFGASPFLSDENLKGLTFTNFKKEWNAKKVGGLRSIGVLSFDVAFNRCPSFIKDGLCRFIEAKRRKESLTDFFNVGVNRNLDFFEDEMLTSAYEDLLKINKRVGKVKK